MKISLITASVIVAVATFCIAVTGGLLAADSYEPDNTPGQAKYIPNNTTQTHSIDPVGDIDWVTFSIGQGSEVTIETSGPSGDTEMWLYDSNLMQLDYNDDIDAMGGNYFSRIDLVCGTDALPAGTYYVGIEEYGENDIIDPYYLTLTVAPCSGSWTIYVDDDAPNDPAPGDPTSSDPDEDGTPDHPFDAIQEGIDAAINGDTVIVKDGTYTGTGNKDLDFNGKAITVKSENGAETCIVDCENAGRGFYFHNGEGPSSVVDSIMITGADNAGIHSYYASPTISGCILTGNSDNAIWCYSGAPTITGCLIYGNTGSYFGTAIYFYGSISGTISNCTIVNNYGGSWGAAVFFEDLFDEIATIANCTISGNTSTDYGGGIGCMWSSPRIENCLITGNFCANNGGGIYLEVTSDPTIVNCTISGNEAGVTGGGICSYDNSSPTVTNTVLWGNGPSELYQEPAQPGTPTLQYCDVAGGWTGTGNIEADPMFVYPGNGNFRLMPKSPCVDAGISTGTPVADLEGRPRYDSPITTNTGGGTPDYYDIGAHEFKGYFVNDDTGNDAWDGLYAVPLGGNNGPKKTIQAAIDETVSADTVVVAPGTYKGTGNTALNYNGKDITVLSKDGVRQTIIDGEGSARGFDFFHYETHMAVLMGFTITNGRAGDIGGGIKCHTDSNPTIIDCVISNGWAGGVDPQKGSGGGIGCDTSAPTLVNCTVTNCTADVYGGGMAFYDGSPTIIGCQVVNNICGDWGGGMFFASSAIPDSCNPFIFNCLVAGNSAGDYGGGIELYHSDATLMNCTIADNTTTNGGGIDSDADNPTITNSILWGNSPEQILVTSGSPTVEYSCVEGGWTGTGNIGANPWDNPMFVTGPLSDYYLSQVEAGQPANSPCTNSGSASAVELGLDKLTTRTDGGKDLFDVDMGYHAPFLLRITAIYPSGNDVVIEWNARDMEVYTVQWSTDMENWNPIYVGPTNTWTDTGGMYSLETYYRIIEN